MKSTGLSLLMVLAATMSQAQVLRRPIASRFIGLGAYSSNHVDVFSMTANQASLVKLKQAGVGVYGERRFMLDATNMYTAVIGLPTSQGNFGLQADYFGFKNYNEAQVGLAYARSLGPKVDLGMKFNYYAVSIPGYGTGSNVNFEIGTMLHLTDQIHAGLHAYNPVGGKFSKNKEEKLSGIYTFGLGYEPTENFLVTADVSKEEDQAANITASMQYNFMKRFYARFGVETETGNAFGGAGLSWKLLRLDATVSYHPHLGYSPGLMLIVNFNQKQD